jgi:hypothetical protein
MKLKLMGGESRHVPVALALTAALLLGLTGCKTQPQDGLVERAQFGIFFGGQVQEREQIPFELDRAKQVHGFRLEFREPLTTNMTVRWELDMPVGERSAGSRHGNNRRVKLGTATARAGQKRLEQLLPFEPQDALGTWNIRVLAGDELAIDRPFLVYDAAQRRRVKRQLDAGAH